MSITMSGSKKTNKQTKSNILLQVKKVHLLPGSTNHMHRNTLAMLGKRLHSRIERVIAKKKYATLSFMTCDFYHSLHFSVSIFHATCLLRCSFICFCVPVAYLSFSFSFSFSHVFSLGVNKTEQLLCIMVGRSVGLFVCLFSQHWMT